MSYESPLTKSLKEHAERLRQRMLAAEVNCEDGVEPLATIEGDWKYINGLLRLAESNDKAFSIALDCVKAIPELDTSSVSALGEKYKRPVESAEHTLYLLQHMGYVRFEEITEVMHRIPTNPGTPATLIAMGKADL